MRTRKNRREDETDKHRWIISYADFITLLFAFFVVMYAISSVNDSKYKSLSEGLHSAFNKKDNNKATVSTAQLKDGPESKTTKGKFRDGMDELSKSLTDLEDGSYKVNRQEGWIELDIKAQSLFESGDSDLKSEAMVKLLQLANKLKSSPYPISIEGYTDNVPINSPQFPSNWELSAGRAAAIGRVLNNYGIATERIMVIGFGEQYPVSENVTEGARSLNRRVVIIIAKNKKVPRILNPGIGRTHSTIINNRK